MADLTQFITSIGSMVRQTTPLTMSIDKINKKIDDLTARRALALDTKVLRQANAEIAALEGQRDRLTNANPPSGMLSGFLSMAADLGKGMLSAGIDKQLKEAGDKGGQAYEMTGRQAETAAGKIIVLQNSINALSASMGSGLLNAMSPLISAAQYLVDYPELLMGIVAALGFLAVALEWAAIKQAFLNFVTKFNPMMLLVTVIIIAVSWIAHLVRSYEGWGQAMQGLWTIIKAFCNNVVILSKAVFQNLIFSFEMFRLSIKHSGQYMLGMVSKIVNAMNLARQAKFAEAKEVLFADIKTTAKAEIETLVRNQKKRQATDLADLTKNFQVMSNTDVLNKVNRKSPKQRDLSLPGAPEMASPSGIPNTLKDTSNGITAGGTKNIHINVQKFFEHLNIYSASVAQGLDDTEQRVKEMLLRVINSTSQSIS